MAKRKAKLAEKTIRVIRVNCYEQDRHDVAYTMSEIPHERDGVYLDRA